MQPACLLILYFHITLLIPARLRGQCALRHCLQPIGVILLMPVGHGFAKGDHMKLVFSVFSLPNQTHPCPDISDVISAGKEVEQFYQEEVLLLNNEDILSAAETGISVFPNPATDFIELRSEKYSMKSWNLYNSVGQLIGSGVVDAGFESRIFVGNMAKGVYVVEVIFDDGRSGVLKVTVF